MKTPAKAMFGIETEYSLSKAGTEVATALPIREFEDAATTVWRGMSFRTNEKWLTNGGLCYVDCGYHPEFATPECTTPWEAARYIKAGDRLMEDAVKRAGDDFTLTRCNVDYANECTWGCHESYLYHRALANPYCKLLVAHLVTRVIYTGAGGFYRRPGKFHFCLAPRLMKIHREISGDSTGDRGILDTRDEPLCRNCYGRMHILCGESLCSETGIVLKIGTTALVVALAQLGLGLDLAISKPVDSLHSICMDTECKKQLIVEPGGLATAIDIQRRLLTLAENHLDSLPDWAAKICVMWAHVLDRLAKGGPEAVSTTLDWAIKYRLFCDRLRRLGRKDFTSCSTAERADLCQADIRFGQLGPRGIFSAMDRSGVLDHKAGIGNVEAAMTVPPAVGRAKLRGEALREAGVTYCSWDQVVRLDEQSNLDVLDLSDPFATEATCCRLSSHRASES